MQHLTNIEEAILNELRRLTKSQQTYLLDFIQSLLPRQEENSLNLLRFAGSFEQQDLSEIQIAISEDCENIDIDEW